MSTEKTSQALTIDRRAIDLHDGKVTSEAYDILTSHFLRPITENGSTDGAEVTSWGCGGPGRCDWAIPGVGNGPGPKGSLPVSPKHLHLAHVADLLEAWAKVQR